MTVSPGSVARFRIRSSRNRITVRSALGQSAVLSALMCAGASTFWPVYRSADFFILVGVSVVLGSAIALAGAFLRLSSLWILLLLVVAFGVFGVALAVPTQAVAGVLPSLEGLRDLVAGVALGWKQLVTISLPVGDYEALLVPAFVLVLPGTTISVTTALRSSRPELALVPPVVAYIAGIVLGPSTAFAPAVTGLVLLSGGVLWVVWWRLRRRRRALDQVTQGLVARQGGTRAEQVSGHRALATRAFGGAVVSLAIAAIVAVAASILLAPASSRWVARDSVSSPFDPQHYVSPLSGFRAYEQKPKADSPQLTVTGLIPGDFVRIATLDTYDGIEYSVGSGSRGNASATFTRVPTSVDQSAVRGRRAKIGVTVDGYSGVWLPTVGKLVSIDFSGRDAAARRGSFFYNDSTGTAADVTELSTGVSYSLSGVVPVQPPKSTLDDLTPGPQTVPTPTSVPAALKTALEGYTTGVSSPGARLQRALNALKKNGYVSHGAETGGAVSRSGHGAERLSQLFTDPQMIGDAEQYAATAALMADELGFPSRVVMGFQATGSNTRAGASTTFRGSDVTAMIEVDTAQYGWVRLDPNPTPRTIPEHQKQDPDQVSRPQSVVQPPPQEAEPPSDQTQPQSKQDNPADPDPWIVVLLAAVTIAGWVALVAGIIMAPFLAIVAVKIRRRRMRRRSRDPARRITGGWDDFYDSLVDHGIVTADSATRPEVASRVGGAAPAVLAGIVDRAVFAPEGASGADADRIWKAVGDMRGQLDSGLTRWQRFRAEVSMKSLRGYHGRRPSKR